MESQTTGTITECTFRIRSQEVDSQKKLKTSALIMLMQEASMQNVLQLKVSVWDMSKDQLSWVLLRKQVKMQRFPTLGEMITIKTYPGEFDRVLAYRDYLVYDEDGDLIGTGASTWTLMNLNTRKIQRIPPEYSEWTHKGEKLGVLESKLKIADEMDSHYDYIIRMSDLDWNNHVNNIVLSKLMIQGAPESFIRRGKPETYTFHIKSECRLHEEIRISSYEHSPVETHHKITGIQDNRLKAMATCIWNRE